MERSSSSIVENLKRIQAEIQETAIQCGRNPADIQLMAVTKTVPAQLVNLAIDQGITLLGENRAQELTEKYPLYQKDKVDIHFIGHLQTNKVKAVVGKVSMIQSVDSLKLAQEISKHSHRHSITTGLLLEINIGGEQSKNGILPEQAEELEGHIALLPNVKLKVIMTIPPIC